MPGPGNVTLKALDDVYQRITDGENRYARVTVTEARELVSAAKGYLGENSTARMQNSALLRLGKAAGYDVSKTGIDVLASAAEGISDGDKTITNWGLKDTFEYEPSYGWCGTARVNGW